MAAQRRVIYKHVYFYLAISRLPNGAASPDPCLPSSSMSSGSEGAREETGGSSSSTPCSGPHPGQGCAKPAQGEGLTGFLGGEQGGG